MYPHDLYMLGPAAASACMLIGASIWFIRFIIRRNREEYERTKGYWDNREEEL